MISTLSFEDAKLFRDALSELRFRTQCWMRAPKPEQPVAPALARIERLEYWMDRLDCHLWHLSPYCSGDVLSASPTKPVAATPEKEG